MIHDVRKPFEVDVIEAGGSHRLPGRLIAPGVSEQFAFATKDEAIAEAGSIVARRFDSTPRPDAVVVYELTFKRYAFVKTGTDTLTLQTAIAWEWTPTHLDGTPL